MSKKFATTFSPLLIILLAVCRLSSASETDEVFADWKLESNIKSAQLVLVARATHVSQVRIVEGAKTSTMLREFRFQPVKILKGIYSRDELSMSDKDLNCAVVDPNSDAPIREGEFRLLILTQRSGLGSYGCAGTPSAPFEQSVPLLSGLDDQLVDVAQSIVKATNVHSRKERTDVLLDQLRKTSGVAAIPLLDALTSRGLFAARNPNTSDVLVELAADQSPEVRRAAIRAIHSVTSNLVERQTEEKKNYAEALREYLKRAEEPTTQRVLAIRSLGNLGQDGRQLKWPSALMSELLENAPTLSERKAAIESIGGLSDKSVIDVVVRSLKSLPLDSPLEPDLIATARKLDPNRCAQVLIERIERSIGAQQSILNEVSTLGRLKHADAVDVLLKAAQRRSVTQNDKVAIAQAFGRIREEQAIPILASWMRSTDTNLRYPAITALVSINTKSAALELRSWIKNEPYIAYKLQIARSIGRHGFDDGYSLAIEHLAEGKMTVLASQALKYINDPRAQKQLTEILDSRPDNRWMAASLTALVALGNEDAEKRLIKTLEDDRSPIILDAIAASTFLPGDRVESLLVKLGQSRNDNLALSSLKQLRGHLRKGQPVGEQTVSTDGQVDQQKRKTLDEESIKMLESVLRDSYANPNVRLEVLRILKFSGGDSIDESLKFLANRTDLEGTPLQLEVEKIIREKNIDL